MRQHPPSARRLPLSDVGQYQQREEPDAAGRFRNSAHVIRRHELVVVPLNDVLTVHHAIGVKFATAPGCRVRKLVVIPGDEILAVHHAVQVGAAILASAHSIKRSQTGSTARSLRPSVASIAEVGTPIEGKIVQ